jgi:multidrug resistance efflux pump
MGQQGPVQPPATRTENARQVAAQPPSSVAVVTPSPEAARQSTSQPAHILPYEQTEILAKTSGFVSQVHVDIGDMVEKDQVLAELWIPEMEQEMLLKEAEVAEAKATIDQMAAAVVAARSLLNAAIAKQRQVQATVAQHEADAAYRRSEYDRIARLVADRALNEAMLDEKGKWLRSAESALAGARAAVSSAAATIEVEKARLNQAKANERHALARLKVAEADFKKSEVLAAYARIKAPFAGLITDRRIDTGAFVATAASNQSEPLFTLCRVDRLRIIVDIPESETSRVQVGQSVELRVDALREEVFLGTIKRTTGVLDTRTRTLRVEAELDSPQSSLRPGMFGLMTIDLSND